ncbi:Uncharacterised protein [Amycolatopsis camponoti]|uniref:Uncharacterized protein n=1 Tax=Amycolatopsis camponoti TaxID=2606593 RepID=A0A6I8M8K5_9PSEU|nr:hypothetical protein [Amycolatopsis camponoti]VVJ25286.1 Uncharacterised protein [Amycolatopsis camponoti]
MFFCRVNGAAFRGITQSGSFRPYAVLKLGANCPNGSQEFSRRFDNEDDSNNNSYSAAAGISSIAQSMVSAGSNTTLNVRIAR